MATRPWQLEGLRETAALAARLGSDVRLLDAEAVRAELHSPTYLGGLWDTDGVRHRGPRAGWPGACGGRAWTQACASSSDARCGRWPATGIRSAPARARHVGGQVSARRVALATGAFSPLLRRLRYYVIPVYDYVLMTEPLSADQLASIGWAHRQGSATAQTSSTTTG